MFWKKWPYWVKGGVILLIIELIFAVVFYWDIPMPNFLEFLAFPILAFSVMAASRLESFDVPVYLINFAYLACIILFSFIFGGIIGLIYGKIKNIIKKYKYGTRN